MGPRRIVAVVRRMSSVILNNSGNSVRVISNVTNVSNVNPSSVVSDLDHVECPRQQFELSSVVPIDMEHTECPRQQFELSAVVPIDDKCEDNSDL